MWSDKTSAFWQGQIKAQYGIEATLRPLDGEFDLNIGVWVDDNFTAVLKIMRPDCPVGLVEMQIKALEQIAKAQCQFDKACYRAEFFYDHINVPDCFDESMSIWADIAPEYEDCSFNEDKAVECLEWYSRSCKITGKELDQLINDCESVWRCG